jgi:deoxyribodipyrimidine photo-lyase
MKKAFVFIFRRDFRLTDNSTLLNLYRKAKENDAVVIPVFIFNPKQISPLENSFYNPKLVRFMLESLYDLDLQLREQKGKLYYFEGSDQKVLEDLCASFTLKCVGFNKDLTPFARRRDEAIKSWCDSKGIDLMTAEDYTIQEVDKCKTGSDTFYQVFTPFKNKAIGFSVRNPQEFPVEQIFFNQSIPNTLSLEKVDDYAPQRVEGVISGGRSNAVTILGKIRSGEFKNYEQERNEPGLEYKTTGIAPYLKFGCVSIREMYYEVVNAYSRGHSLISELFWRDFFTQLYYR